MTERNDYHPILQARVDAERAATMEQTLTVETVPRRGGPGDNGRRRYTPIQKEQMMARIAAGYLRGATLAQMSRELNVAPSMVAALMKVIERRWRERADADFARARAAEIAKLDHLEETYWQAWERSLEEKKKDERIIVPLGDLDEKGKPKLGQKRHKVATEESMGDPRFLDGVFRCIDRRIKLLGLDAAERIGPGGTSGELNALEQRIRQYAIVLAPRALPDSTGHPGHDDPHEPLDSERPASEASGILDADYVER